MGVPEDWSWHDPGLLRVAVRLLSVLDQLISLLFRRETSLLGNNSFCVFPVLTFFLSTVSWKLTCKLGFNFDGEFIWKYRKEKTFNFQEIKNSLWDNFYFFISIIFLFNMRTSSFNFSTIFLFNRLYVCS